MAGLRQKKRGTGNGLKGAWENESHGGGDLLASNEALIRLGSGEGVGVEKRPVNTQKHHVFPPFIFPLSLSLFPFPSIPSLTTFPHSSDKMAGRGREGMEKVKGAAVAWGSGGALGKAHH